MPYATMRENTEWGLWRMAGNMLGGVDYGKIADPILGFEGAGEGGDVLRSFCS